MSMSFWGKRICGKSISNCIQSPISFPGAWETPTAKGYDRNPKKDKRGLTPQEAVFADNVLEVGQVKAAELAYPDATPESQEVMASRNMSKPQISSTISKMADLRGVKREDCLDAIKRGLEAETVMMDKMGEVHHSVNNAAQLKAAELGLKLHRELGNDEKGPAVTMTKDLFVELCSVFWRTKPSA